MKKAALISALVPVLLSACAAGPDDPIRVDIDADTGEPAPYVHVRRGLEARIARPVFYELVEMAETRETPEGPQYGVASQGAWFPIALAGEPRP